MNRPGPLVQSFPECNAGFKFFHRSACPLVTLLAVGMKTRGDRKKGLEKRVVRREEDKIEACLTSFNLRMTKNWLLRFQRES